MPQRSRFAVQAWVEWHLAAHRHRKLGIGPQQVASHLAILLPQVVNHLTSSGQMPASGAIGDALGALKSKLGQ